MAFYQNGGLISIGNCSVGIHESSDFVACRYYGTVGRVEQNIPQVLCREARASLDRKHQSGDSGNHRTGLGCAAHKDRSATAVAAHDITVSIGGGSAGESVGFSSGCADIDPVSVVGVACPASVRSYGPYGKDSLVGSRLAVAPGVISGSEGYESSLHQSDLIALGITACIFDEVVYCVLYGCVQRAVLCVCLCLVLISPAVVAYKRAVVGRPDYGIGEIAA